MGSPELRNRVLVVDDEAPILEEYQYSLGDRLVQTDDNVAMLALEQELFGQASAVHSTRQFDVEVCSQGGDAVKRVKEGVANGDPFAVVFLDLQMPPGIDGLQAAEEIRAIDPNINIVIVTGSAPVCPETFAQRVPPVDRLFLFQKPFHAVECRQLATALCSKWRADQALRKSHELLERRVAESTVELHRLAYYDAATGLPNRNKLLRDLDELINAARRGGTMVGVLLLDIERFGFINETMGYESGTELLGAIGARLEGIFRGTDIAGRFGSDEFACLVGNVGDQAALREIVARVEGLFSEPFRLGGRELFLKVGVGVASYPVHGREAEEVFRCAEAALHRSKRHVIHETTYYERAMGEFARRQLELEAELRAAISNGEIKPYLQPQICLRTGEVSGAEALARWIRPDGTVISPGEFIPLAEEVGLSDAIFETMLRQLADEISAWRREVGWNAPTSINISAHQLRNPHFSQLILSVLAARGLSPDTIKLELTETVLLDDLSVAKHFLAELVSHGVGIQIDDFGTGYSSLSYLAELPVQSLKIDQVFVSRLLDEPTQARVVQAVIALGSAFELQVVAEGVEEKEQLDYLRENDCDFAQGYLIARPMPPAEFVSWLTGTLSSRQALA